MIKKEKESKSSCLKKPDRKNFGRKVRWEAAAAVILTAVLLLCDIPNPVIKSSAMSRTEMQQKKNRPEKRLRIKLSPGVREKSETEDPESENLLETEFCTEQEMDSESEPENAEMESDPESEILSESELESETELQSELESELELEAEQESESFSRPETETESETESELEFESEPESVEPESDPKPEPPLESESESENAEPESELGTEISSELETEILSESESEPESQSESELESELETELQSELEPESESESEEPEPGLETESESEPEISSGMEPESEIQSELELESESESAESESELQSEFELESEVQSEIETELESELETETQSEFEPESELQSETEPESELQSETEPELESESEIQSELETESESESVESESELQSEFEQESEVQSESETELESESEIQSELETESEPESTESESELEPETQSEPESETENVETESESETELESETEIQSELETESEPESTELESELEPETQSELELETENVETESESEPEISSELETELQSTPGPESETENETEDYGEPENQEEGNEVISPEDQVEIDPELADKLPSESENAEEFEVWEGEPESLSGELEEKEEESESRPGKSKDQPGKETEAETVRGPGHETGGKSGGGQKMPAETRPKENELQKGETPKKEQKKEKDFQTGEIPQKTEENSQKQKESESQTQLQTEQQNSWTGISKEKQENPEKDADVKEEKQALRGQDYEIHGDTGAWYRDEKDRLWVRKGSGLTADPVGETYNQGSRKTVLSGDGVFHFNLKQVDTNGSIVSESPGVYETYYVDGEVPAAKIAVDGNRSGNQVFSPTGTISISAPPDAQSGLKRTSYQIVLCDENGTDAGVAQDGSAWISCGNMDKISLDKEGFYRVYARTEDHVGNVSVSKSEILCVDRTMPELVVEGIQNQTANSGEVSVKVRCSDKRYQTGSLQVSLVGLNNGIVIEPLKKKEGNETAVVVFEDFPRERKYDDIYLLTVRAQDIAGNISEKSMRFSVNRCGSVYDLNGTTREKLQKYYVQEPFDVLISETNVDYVGESKIFCRRDGILHELVKDQDYQVILEGRDDSWKQYQYKINKDIFAEEGVYELLLTSRDKANNSSDTGIQQKKMTFAVDRTPPSCMISGIEDQGVYRAKKMKVRVHAEDNICLKTMKIYRNGEMWKELSAAELEETGGRVNLSVKEKNDWQTLQVYLEDACGNTYQSREMPFYLSANMTEQDVPEYGTGTISRKEEERKTEKRTSGNVFPAFGLASKTEYGMAVLLAGILSLLSVLIYCGFSGIKRKG